MYRKSKDTPGRAPIDLGRYYRKESLFDHPSEYVFYKILRDEILGTRFIALLQVPVSSLVEVRNKRELGWKAHFGRIARKRVDFVICRIEDMKPMTVIELDGSTHQNVDRQARDALLDNIFAAVGLPIVHINLQGKYDRVAITKRIAEAMGLRQRQAS